MSKWVLTKRCSVESVLVGTRTAIGYERSTCDRIHRNVRSIESDVTSIQWDVNSIGSDVSNIQTDVSSIESNVSRHSIGCKQDSVIELVLSVSGADWAGISRPVCGPWVLRRPDVDNPF